MKETNPNFKRVKITQSRPGKWYNGLIGEVFDVYNYDGYFYLLSELNPCQPGVGRYISKNNCEIVERIAPKEQGGKILGVEAIRNIIRQNMHVLHYEGEDTVLAQKLLRYFEKQIDQPSHYYDNDYDPVGMALYHQFQIEQDIEKEQTSKFSQVPDPNAPTKEGAEVPIPADIHNFIRAEFDKPENACYNFDQFKEGAIAMYQKMQEEIKLLRQDNSDKQDQLTIAINAAERRGEMILKLNSEILELKSKIHNDQP
jgi:hypothetical protein